MSIPNYPESTCAADVEAYYGSGIEVEQAVTCKENDSCRCDSCLEFMEAQL